MRLQMRLNCAEDSRRAMPGMRFPCSEVVVRGGVEPPTFRFSGGRSYQLSYLTIRGLTVPTALPQRS